MRGMIPAALTTPGVGITPRQPVSSAGSGCEEIRPDYGTGTNNSVRPMPHCQPRTPTGLTSQSIGTEMNNSPQPRQAPRPARRRAAVHVGGDRGENRHGSTSGKGVAPTEGRSTARSRRNSFMRARIVAKSSAALGRCVPITSPIGLMRSTGRQSADRWCDRRI